MEELVFDIRMSHVGESWFRKDFQKVQLSLHCMCEQLYIFKKILRPHIKKLESVILLGHASPSSAVH